GLALGMHRDEFQIFRGSLRHSRWRNGFEIPPPRMRNRTRPSGQRKKSGELLDARQYVDLERQKNGQKYWKQHSSGRNFFGKQRYFKQGFFAQRHSFFYAAGQLPQRVGFFGRSTFRCGKRFS